jgi:NADPH:quinone reductase-like Zn-dependent oxidoreductase
MLGAGYSRDRTVLITGASSGIGREIAMSLTRMGTQVAMLARRKALLDDLKGQVESAGARALALGADVLRKAPRHPHHVPDGQLRRKFANLAIQRGAEFEESAQALRLTGKVENVRSEKVFDTQRRREAEPREHRSVEGIHFQEGTAITNHKQPEKSVDEPSPGILREFTAANLMDGRIEDVLLPLKSVRVPAGSIVALDD